MTRSVNQFAGNFSTSLKSGEVKTHPGRVVSYPKVIRFLFYIFAIYLVIPIIDIPLLGLSLSAPFFFVIAIVCILRPPAPWLRKYSGWILLAGLLWLGIFTSTWANGLLSGGSEIDSGGISIVIHYAYWLLVFVVTVYFFSQGKSITALAKVLGWGIFILASLRWIETLFYDNIGAWTGTKLLSQNSYGFLFSSFSPFLLLLALQAKGWIRLPLWSANLFLWGAAAINGSRGSWLAIGIGLGLMLAVFTLSKPHKFLGMLIMIFFLAVFAITLWGISPRISIAVTSRFNTFQNLDDEKSYMIRQLMIQKGLRLFEESPLIGVGADRFTKSSIPLEIPRVLSYATQEHFDVKSAHNSYIGFLAEYGLLGAIPFAILLIILSIGGIRSAFHYSRAGQYWALAIFISFVQMSIHMWAINSITNTSNWFLYGLVAALIVLYRNRKQV